MGLLNKKNLLSLFFVYFFVLQEFWSYSVNSLEIHHPYWIVILSILGIVSIRILTKSGNSYKLPFIYTIMLVIGAFTTVYSGNSIGFCFLKGLFAAISFSSLVFVTKHKINLRLFELLLIGAYIYYYYTYFVNLQSIENKNAYDGDVFVTSSANTISICLNCILFIYFILNKYYKENNQIRILVFSIINMGLIVIQESRAGVVVGLLLIMVLLYDMFSYSPSFKKKILLGLMVLIVIAGIINNISLMSNYFTDIGLHSNSYEANIRHFAQIGFFENMDVQSFLFGYHRGQLFAGLDRTFNSYLDLWNRYGFVSFCFFVCFFVRRIIMNNNFSISIIYFLPIMVYAFVETLFAGTLWDMCFMYMLFLSDTSIEKGAKKIVRSGCAPVQSKLFNVNVYNI